MMPNINMGQTERLAGLKAAAARMEREQAAQPIQMQEQSQKELHYSIEEIDAAIARKQAQAQTLQSSQESPRLIALKAELARRKQMQQIAPAAMTEQQRVEEIVLLQAEKDRRQQMSQVAPDALVKQSAQQTTMASEQRTEIVQDGGKTLPLAIYYSMLGLVLVAMIGFISIKFFKAIRNKYKNEGLRLNIISFKEKTYLCLKVLLEMVSQVRGFKRLLLAMSILWFLLVVIYSIFHCPDMVGFLGVVLFANIPVWLNWFAYWIFLGFKLENRSLKAQLWSISIILVLLLIVFSLGFGGIFVSVGFPVWLSWLIYWVYLGFKKEKS